MGFQENLRHYREQAKFTPTEMAKHLKVAYNTYVGYEVRGREPKYTTLCKIADLLQVSTDDLLGRTTNILGKNEDDLLEKIINESIKIGDCKLLKLSRISSDYVYFTFDDIQDIFKFKKDIMLKVLNDIKLETNKNEKYLQGEFFKFIQDTAFINFGKQQIKNFENLINTVTDEKEKAKLQDDLYKQITLVNMLEEKYNKDYQNYLQEDK
ncbi:helix-turn-helix domain-containing protein [Megamonas funiformis]|uniref:helix-turn-helix domain-containing protein n=1 Tax=Megamonas funiformis TaxID=437897 RepID=UPI003A90B32B